LVESGFDGVKIAHEFVKFTSEFLKFSREFVKSIPDLVLEDLNLELDEAMSKFNFYMFSLFCLVAAYRSWLRVVAIWEVRVPGTGSGSTKKC
jgi:hypothetical protein